jgi:uracil-DNA glycosylase family 4
MSQNCDCELNTGKLIPFTFPSSHEDFNGLMFVGESPGRDEEKEGRGFVGRAGKMLRKAASDSDVDIHGAIIANAARCQIYKKEMSAKRIKQVLATCRPYLAEVILRWKPKVIIALGDIAMQQLIKKSGITKHRGDFYWSDEFGCYVLPMFHPAFILRQMDQLHYLNQDFKTLHDFIENDFRKPTDTKPKRYVEIQSIRPLLHKADAGNVIRVALDTETHTLDYTSPDACVISYSVSGAKDTGYQLFLWERGASDTADNNRRITLPEGTALMIHRSDKYWEKLRELFELVEHPNIRLVMQNGNFDKHQIREEFRRAGLVPPEFKAFSMDIQVGAHIINENIFRQAGLENMSQAFLNDRGRWKKEFYESGANASAMILSDRASLTKYAAQDADMTLQIGNKIKDQIGKEPKLANYFVKLAMPVLSKALFTLEENGLYIDRQRLETVRRELQSRTVILEKQTLALIPEAIRAANEGKLKLSRGDLIAQTLFHPEGFDNPVQFMTASGEKPSTDANARQHLLDSDISMECREFITLYEEWSETNKITVRD